MTEFIYFCTYHHDEGVIVEYPHPFNDGEIKSKLYKVFSQVGNSSSIDTFKNGNLFYSAQKNNGIIFGCVSHETTSVTKISNFLKAAQMRWFERYGSSSLNNPTILQNDFGPLVPHIMKYDSGDNKIEKVRKEVDTLKTIMIDDVMEKLIERESKIETLVDKTSNLSTNSATFKTKATKLKRHMKCRRWKMWIIIFVSLLILAYIITAIVCKGPHLPKCVKKNSQEPVQPGPTPQPPVKLPVQPPVPVPIPVHPPVPPSVQPSSTESIQLEVLAF